MQPGNPHPGCTPHVVSNERCRLVVYVRALGYFNVLTQNLPGDIKENNYVTFLCVSYASIENIRGGVRSMRGLGPTMTAWGQCIGISIGMLPQIMIMSRLDQLSQLGARI
jgi:hypothetical protein